LVTEQDGGFELLRSDCAPATRHAPLITLLNAKLMWSTLLYSRESSVSGEFSGIPAYDTWSHVAETPIRDDSIANGT
jgi:hypothetical protein